VEIESFVWTEHAEDRLRQRRLDASDVEEAIKDRHAERDGRSCRMADLSAQAAAP
jgi:hypothetical protein